MKYISLIPLLLPLASQASPFQCKDFGGILGRCELKAETLSQPVTENSKKYHTDFSVHYSFVCSGHSSLNIGLRSSDGFVPFSLGTAKGTLQISGVDSLKTYDPNPSLTKRLSFRPGCALKIKKVVISPSTLTLRTWNEEAENLAEIIDELLYQYDLAFNLQEIHEYSRTKLKAMRSYLEELISYDPDAEYPETEDFIALLSVVNQLLAGTELPIIPEGAKDSLTKAILEKLEIKKEEALELKKRFEKYGLKFNKELEDVLKEVQ